MPVTQLKPQHATLAKTYAEMCGNERVFLAAGDDGDAIVELKRMLREDYKLSAYSCAGGSNVSDLFSAMAQVMYKTLTLKTKVPTSDGATFAHQVEVAAMQLRAVACSQIMLHYNTDERVARASMLLGESVSEYVDRVMHGEYRGDLFCLVFLSQHFKRACRVWLPGNRSVLFPYGNQPTIAFQLMLTTPNAATSGSLTAASYAPCWSPVAKHEVRFSTKPNQVQELVTTDEERAARITQDPVTRLAMRLPDGFATGPLKPTPSPYSKKRDRGEE